MWKATKSFFAWVYNWVTVISASIVGAVLAIGSEIDLLTGIDFSSILPADRAAKVLAVIGITKAVLAIIAAVSAWWSSRKAA